ncbi:MAG: hypothetical protein MUO26_11670 [Methanotrichaceae archaeon]|nr:hypothetical protein [Methanotrichaceae archaeon]
MLKNKPETSWINAEQMPHISATAYVDDSATLIGDVHLGNRVICGSRHFAKSR